MIIVAVEAVPAGSKPPAAVSVYISTGERHDFGAAAPLPTMTSSLQQGRAGGSAVMPKLAELVGPVLTLFCRTAIPMLRLICRSVLRTNLSPTVFFLEPRKSQW